MALVNGIDDARVYRHHAVQVIVANLLLVVHVPGAVIASLR